MQFLEIASVIREQSLIFLILKEKGSILLG